VGKELSGKRTNISDEKKLPSMSVNVGIRKKREKDEENSTQS
jgi:hypothetical protein